MLLILPFIIFTSFCSREKREKGKGSGGPSPYYLITDQRGREKRNGNHRKGEVETARLFAGSPLDREKKLRKE